MSAISKYDWFHKKSFETILNDIHNTVYNNYLSQNASYLMQKQEGVAKKIQKQLQDFKIKLNELGKVNVQDTTLTYLGGEIFQAANEGTKVLNLMSKGTYDADKDSTLLFRRRSSMSSDQIAETFERQLAAFIIAGLEGGADTENKTVNSSMVKEIGTGSSYAILDNYLNISPEVQKLLDDYGKKKIQEWRKAFEKNKYSFGYKQGKIDINLRQVLNGIEIKADVNPFIKELITIMAGYTYSLKNYASTEIKIEDLFETTSNPFYQIFVSQVEKEDYRIGFGNTSLYRAVTGALSEIYSDPNIINIIYFRGLTYLRDATDPPDSTTIANVKQHFGHLKVIYEIKGSGLIDQKGNSGIVDFIIFNDPSSVNIFVKSANVLIAEELKRRIESNNQSIGGVRIAAQNFYS